MSPYLGLTCGYPALFSGEGDAMEGLRSLRLKLDRLVVRCMTDEYFLDEDCRPTRIEATARASENGGGH